MRNHLLAHLGDWTFWEVWDHGFTGPEYDGKPLFGYEKISDPGETGKPRVKEYHRSLDRAIIAAVSEKYTGPRGAGGTGVGTAADWFARMIGMDALVEPDYSDGREALSEALAKTRSENGPIYRRARAVADELEARGIVLAVKVHP
jgi:hypothetical protein